VSGKTRAIIEIAKAVRDARGQPEIELGGMGSNW